MNSYPNPQSRRIALALTLLLFAATAASAFAHPNHGQVSSFTPGLLHPLSGWDHALAMIAVGLWAAQIGRSGLLAASFLANMAVGGVLGHFGGPISGLEQGIAVSVLVMGLLVAQRVKMSTWVAASLVGAFAVFHGWAHGAELPASAGGVAYGAGFLISTALLLAAGTWAGRLASRFHPVLAAAAGWTVAAAGLILVVR